MNNEQTEITKLKEIIKKSHNIVFFGGAGVSTESKIPDFRSSNGLYQKTKYPYPAEVMLSKSFFDNHKKEFYDFYLKEMIYLDAMPNKAHIALTKLEKLHKLKAIITQNIDGLHQKAGSKNVIELHGSVKRNYCLDCHHFFNEKEIIKNQGICPFCQGYIKPDVVLYEEQLNMDNIDKAIDYIMKAETLIVGGTSLSVYPAASFIEYFHGKTLVLINEAKTAYDSYADLIIHEKIGDVLDEACKD